MVAIDLSRYIWPDADLGRQPQGAAQRSEIIRDAVACAPIVGQEFVAAQSATWLVPRETTTEGIAATFSSGHSITVNHGYTGAAYTLIALGDFTHRTEERHVLNNDDVGANRVFQLRLNSLNVEFIPFDAGGAPTALSVSTSGFTTTTKTRTRTIIARAGGGKIALDVTDCGSASGTVASHKAMVGYTMVGNMIGATSYGNSDKTLAYAIVPRYMSDGEVKRILDAPWQIFRSPIDIGWPGSAAGGSSTSLTVQDSQHGHLADSLSFSMATYLAVAESLHSHAADNITLTTTGTANLVVQEAAHGHTADGIVLTTDWLLAIAESVHAHAVDNLTLGTTGATSLLIADAISTHVADNVALSLQTVLSVIDALHGHAAENLTLGITGATNLVIADAISGHSADNLAFSLNTLLAVFNAIHAHPADNLTLDTSNTTFLTVQDAAHSHVTGAVGLSLDTWLFIVAAAHSHTAGAPTLSATTALQIAEALHAQYADVTVLSFPGETTLTTSDVTNIVAAVIAALNTTTIPVDVHKVLTTPVTGVWPTAIENADTLLSRTWP